MKMPLFSIYLSYERMCEVKSAKRIVSMILQEGFTKIDDLDSKIDNAERTLHQRLAPSQRNAVKLCLSHPISIMTGGPGSGKTTTLRFILDIYKAAFPANEVLLAAPTGRASRRMAEQTGMHASTLHSALGLVTDEDSPLNDKELLSADLVVVDEFSMVDMRLAYILLDRIKSGAQLIIVGDADQLPSVGAGNVLREMIRSEKVPTAVLETVFRQASNMEVFLIMPTTPEGKAKLSKELAKFHAEQALKMVQKLPCPTEQKLELIDAVVEHLRSKQ